MTDYSPSNRTMIRISSIPFHVPCASTSTSSRRGDSPSSIASLSTTTLQKDTPQRHRSSTASSYRRGETAWTWLPWVTVGSVKSCHLSVRLFLFLSVSFSSSFYRPTVICYQPRFRFVNTRWRLNMAALMRVSATGKIYEQSFSINVLTQWRRLSTFL